MTSDTRLAALKAYEVYIPTATPQVERLFKVILLATLLLFLWFGMFLRGIKQPEREFYERVSAMRTQFLIREQPKPEPKVRKVTPPKSADKSKARQEPIDLTEKPLINQEEDDIQQNKPEQKKVRRVYGLRRVYSRGLGTGGTMADAVIGKLGNTLNKDVDTITATQGDIKGNVVSVTSITSSPSLKKRVRPKYTQEMLDNKVEGVIRVKVLVDIDGRVKKAVALNDLGYGSARLAVEACYQLEFGPAMRGAEPVAVWITVPMRFVLLG
jgi:hypothetical protein